MTATDGTVIELDREYSDVEVAEMFGVNRSQPPRWANQLRDPLRIVSRKPFRVLGSELVRFRHARDSRSLPNTGPGVRVMPKSGNAKLGDAAATYVARQSCPSSCPFKASGCYAEHDNTRAHWDRLTRMAADLSPLQLAQAEADQISDLPGSRDMRLHVAGDSVTREGTRVIAEACREYVERGRAEHGKNVRVWAYTHGWREVDRTDWGTVSVLASCETPEMVREAKTRGYAAALVVERFASDRAYVVEEGVKVIPCPAQTRDVKCTDCRLCLDEPRLWRTGTTIAFALHGGGVNKAKAAMRRVSLPVLGDQT